MTNYYKNIIKECDVLSKEELINLWKRWKEENDQEAYQKLIFSQLRLAFQIADKLKRFYPGECEEDVKSEATLAVISALKWWNPEKGCLSTITTIICQQRIWKFLLINKYVIQVPYYVLRRLSKDAEAYPQVRELIENLIYLNDNVTIKSNDDPLKEILKKEEVSELRKALKKLEPIERKIICEYYGIEGKAKSLQEISKQYNLGELEIMEIITKCKDKLQRFLDHLKM